MPLQFVPFTEMHLEAVLAFNRRMREGNAPTVFFLPESPSQVGDRDQASGVRRTQFLATENDRVRGGVIELDQPGWLNGHSVRALNFQSPLSEGIVNSKYASVGLQIVRFMQNQSPAAYIIGMGSTQNPLPRLLKAAGWTLKDIPFLFRVHRSTKFFRELRPLHSTWIRSLAANTAALSGAGALALAWKQRSRVVPRLSIRAIDAWGDWASELWCRVRNECSFAVERDRATLQALYPAEDPRTKIYLMEQERKPVAWAVCYDTQMRDNKYFGDMRIATILDCVSGQSEMRDCAVLVDREMRSRGVDLVLVNHTHSAWIGAFRSAGFLSGPSNYLLGMSKALTKAVQEFPGGESRMHITRGDGDGRVNL